MINKIICGDSLQILKTIPDNFVDIVLTSPPYNFNKHYDNYNDKNTIEDYFKLLNPILVECIRVLKFGGRFIINIQPHYSNNIPTHHIVTKFLLDNNMMWRTEIIWEKNNYNCPTTCWGSFCSPSAPYLRVTWEYVNVYCKDNIKHDGLKENIDIDKSEFAKWTYAKWIIAPENKMKKKYGHPAMFPEELVERCLKLFSYKNDIVLDPFNGCGTTTRVSKLLGRRYIGIDISEKYCNVAKHRLIEGQNRLKEFYE